MQSNDYLPNISNYLTSKKIYNTVKNRVTDEIIYQPFIGGNCNVVFVQTFNYICTSIIEKCLRECMDNYNSVPTHYEEGTYKDDVDIYIESFITFSIHDIINENIFEKTCYSVLFKADKFEIFRDIILEECLELDSLIFEDFDSICNDYKKIKEIENDI